MLINDLVKEFMITSDYARAEIWRCLLGILVECRGEYDEKEAVMCLKISIFFAPFLVGITVRNMAFKSAQMMK
ncbi:hypothetical protein SLEP1_g34760 [Rubroshorea leprosula]|uniref:Uncharacterized protein n=1 Tax=Rubroshorea leprosula TaxID=152421 RepID=A0AAV5KL15_9ROSI|nr:hypothetical protein SLEP1_g34760 [Rubroshorea leprosula]